MFCRCFDYYHNIWYVLHIVASLLLLAKNSKMSLIPGVYFCISLKNLRLELGTGSLYSPTFREEVFSESASEFLCEGVSRCLLLRCATGAKGHLASVLTHKVAQY
jgi:hypothetical protein